MKLLESARPFEKIEDVLTRKRGFAERGRHLKQNQAGSLRKKIRKACPRCNKGTLKKVSSNQLKCNAPKCGYRKYWAPTWETYGGQQ